MSYAEICDKVEMIQKKYHESNPFRLCSAMDIMLIFRSMGNNPNAIKGFFLESKRIRTITVNDDLPLVIQKVIVFTFHDLRLFDESSLAEKEANLFAAEYLLSDEEVLDVLNRDTTFFTAAAKLTVPVELLDFKFRIMKWKGYKLSEPPMESRSDFFEEYRNAG